ncbi:hypothetical protein DL96DRAFT_1606085 [Flagelloscypha sp. PMI_526]|nr:hypothetical protein DL96DRAFT_1606085 [Flagelloscypha sp. PMI_526]
MRFTGASFVLSLLTLATAAPAAEERALPSGHPVIDNSFLSENGLATSYTLKANIFPSGFAVPTVAMTALPSGYSVAYNGVFDPSGKTVSQFPSDAIAQVAAVSSSSSAPGAPAAATSAAASASTSATPNAASAISQGMWLASAFVCLGVLLV